MGRAVASPVQRHGMESRIQDSRIQDSTTGIPGFRIPGFNNVE
jgi:hypothetical protein